MSGSYRTIDKKTLIQEVKLNMITLCASYRRLVVIYNDPRRFGYILLQRTPSDHEN